MCMQFRSRIIRAGKDRKGNIRKFVSVPQVYIDEFNVGDVVEITKVKNIKENEVRMPNPDQSKTPGPEIASNTS